ncbi:MAG TPA: HAD-IC family P-type ATPase, partial [Roseiflexaceae bacterium]|nr:HAD-IC family P-type ATPase [Roseiflexaceae bacterium]
MTSSDHAAAYQQPAAAVIAALGADEQYGLTTEEVRRRLEQYGPNELRAEPPISAWRKFLAQFQSPLIILLVIAAAFSLIVWLYEGDEALPYEALVIFAIVLLNGILGFVQEERAERSVAALQAMAAAEASVLRDGQLQRVAATDIVPGDIILIEEGDTIPADGRLIHSVALQTAEASLTGESLPVFKDTDTLTEEVGIGDRSNMVFSGTAATYGRGRAVVTATGMHTEMGKIAGLLRQTESEPTPLQQELDRTGKLLGVVVLIMAVVMVVTIIVVEGIREFSAIVDVLILGVALAVAAVPEGLPTVVTAVLSLGVQRMAKRNAIVRKLPAVETLGSATVIASDKTGTLTKNEMTVRTVVTASGRVDITGTGYAPEGELRQDGHALEDEALRTEVSYTLGAADRANNAVLQQRDGRWAIQGDPTEGALIVAYAKLRIENEKLKKSNQSERQGTDGGLASVINSQFSILNSRFPRVGEVPFSSERKLMSTVHTDVEQPERLLVFTKGAPDIMLRRCKEVWVGDGPQPLTEERCAHIREVNEQLAGAALRTLGIAFRSLPRDALDPPDTVSDQIE